ncbi:hypothetical protein BD408DRAFT_412725 [Parasitella parasitica]|nr:hypothetical protein BD408DRAFT_412725 [Parasitella parasitica]
MNVQIDETIATDNKDITIPEKPCVYLGALYHDTQQYSHFAEYYHLYIHLPPLVHSPATVIQQQQQKQQQPKDADTFYKTAIIRTKSPAVSFAMMPTSSSETKAVSSPSPMDKANGQQSHIPYKTRVSVIPSFAPKNQSLRNMHKGTTTLTLKPEPCIPSKVSGTQKRRLDISVFSGPHYQPEKYAIKTSTDMRNEYALPDQVSLSSGRLDSKYFVPRLDDHFMSALKDGSYFESYSEYNSKDPENFRHAVSIEHGTFIANIPARSNEINQIYTTTREIAQFRPSQTQQDRYVIQTHTTSTNCVQDKRALHRILPLRPPVSSSHQLTPSSTPPLPLPSHRSHKPPLDTDIEKDQQDERVNQILEAANLFDFSGQITFTTDYEESSATATTTTTTSMKVSSNHHKLDIVPRVIPSRGWQSQNSDSTGCGTDQSSDDDSSNEEDYTVYENETSLKRNRRGRKKKVARKADSPSDDKASCRSHRGSIRTAGKTVACLPPVTAATCYMDENETTLQNLSSGTLSSSPAHEESVSPFTSSSEDDNDSDLPIIG